MPAQPPDMLPPPAADVPPAGVGDDSAHPTVLHRRGIPLLPNAFTPGHLHARLYAIAMALTGEFQWSAIPIVLAMFLHSLYGRAARPTNSHRALSHQ